MKRKGKNRLKEKKVKKKTKHKIQEKGKISFLSAQMQEQG